MEYKEHEVIVNADTDGYELDFWMENNIKGGWYALSEGGENMPYYFQYEEDAIAFKLKWC